ncbi:MAG: hypothetical protein M1819_001136 [Sarea resinae]|nr:MAG: hypothetical protein M1819_001136 [Sarea resinae]
MASFMFRKPKSDAKPKMKKAASKQELKSMVNLPQCSANITGPPDQWGSACGDKALYRYQQGPAAQSVPCLPPPSTQQLGRQPASNLQKPAIESLQSVNGKMDLMQVGATHWLNHGAALYELMSSRLDAVITSIDGELFNGDEREFIIYQAPTIIVRDNPMVNANVVRLPNDVKQDPSVAITTSRNHFSKVHLYANSRLPPNLPPLKLYIPTWPLICLAAQYSERVYNEPSGAERETLIGADWRLGTKAMVIKSVPLDAMNTVVFAIRGTQTFMDWAVNLKTTPASPEGFLDDAGNLCHSGFLAVARKMVKPVAARLRTLLEEDPSRSTFSLLITGHSAGGAIASLLYSHMVSETIESELNLLTGCFKRIHCITFGSPPVSLLPLQKPHLPRLHNSLFLSFINEGDPVTRADRAYVRSLLDLYASPSPGSSCLSSLLPLPKKSKSPRPLCQKAKDRFKAGKPAYHPSPQQQEQQQRIYMPLPIWTTPPSILSNAGRLVLLRSESLGGGPATARVEDGPVRACITTDQELRRVVFGDPVMHMMTLYARRVETLATEAVTARMVMGA